MKFTLAAAITAFASAVYAQVAFVPNSGVAVNLPFLGVSYPPPAERLITKLTLFFSSYRKLSMLVIPLSLPGKERNDILKGIGTNIKSLGHLFPIMSVLLPTLTLLLC